MNRFTTATALAADPFGRRAGASEAEMLELLGRLTSAMELRDQTGGTHGSRVAQVAARLATLAGFVPQFVADLQAVIPLHDLGKIAIPETILQKDGPLTPAERAIVNTHTEVGASIMGSHDTPLLKLAAEVALCHHERWDGTGYPNGLAGKSIPVSCRLVAIADTFDALLSRRSYKDVWSPEAVRQYMQSQYGLAYDPELLDIFLAHFDEMLELRRSVEDVWVVD